MIKVIPAFLTITISSFSMATPQGKTLHAISNIDQSTVTLALDDPRGKTSFRELNLKTLKTELLPPPIDLEAEEVLALFRFAKDLILISQWTAGGGKPPSIRFFSGEKKDWSLLGRLNCISFDNIEIEKGKLKVRCEPDILKGKKAEITSFTLPSKKWKAKAVLPRMLERSGELSVSLEGPMFRWSEITIKNGTSVKKVSVEKLE